MPMKEIKNGGYFKNTHKIRRGRREAARKESEVNTGHNEWLPIELPTKDRWERKDMNKYEQKSREGVNEKGEERGKEERKG